MFFVYRIIKFALSLRYKITVKGMENLNPENLSRSGGILFLPNHPSQLDPVIVSTAIWKKYKPRALMVEYMYYTPGVNWLAKMVRALPVPNFDLSMNSYKRKRNDKVFSEAADCLEKGENFLLYPGGRLKHTSVEIIGGASGVQRLLQEAPNVNVVLVRSTGLWGSRHSRAISGEVPPFGKTLWGSIKIVFKNLIFFAPKRHVELEMVPAPKDFPYSGSRDEVNRYLENFYNRTSELTVRGQRQLEGEPFVRVSNYFWKEDYPAVTAEKSQYEDVVDVSGVSKEVKDKVVEHLAKLARRKPEELRLDMHLSMDLGLDSLDGADIVTFLEDYFEVEGVLPGDLTTVSRVISIAAKQTELEGHEVEEESSASKQWFKEGNRPDLKIADGHTLGEVFLRQCDRMKGNVACVDHQAKVMTYRQIKMRALLLAKQIEKYPGKYIGILMPSSIAGILMVFACHLAKKIPVMINWTVGRRHLETVVEVTGIETVFTSWKFLDRLEGADLTGVDDKFVMLEDVARKISLKEKLSAFFQNFKSADKLMKNLGIDSVSDRDPAVMLFTSGSEGMPKGVPLSHYNILCNQRSAFSVVGIKKDDVLYGMLPFFHSFGFSVIGTLPILAGLKVAFYPNPTDSIALAKGIKKWGITFLCSAPTFLRAIIRSGIESDFDSVRLFVTGAEKPAPDLREMIEAMPGERSLLDAYGITECAPALAFTLPGEKPVGVGKPIPGVEFLIVDPESLEPLATGERGLILAHGPNVFSGYANKGAKSPFVEVRNKRWYVTGDLGFLDESNNLTLSGRFKRFIKVGGEMISLRALEDALLEAAPLHGWLPKKSQEGPILAVCAKEEAGEKTTLHLFCIFKASVQEVNTVLREQGFSNLVRFNDVIQLKEIPVMGTGKVFYRSLESNYLGV